MNLLFLLRQSCRLHDRYQADPKARRRRGVLRRCRRRPPLQRRRRERHENTPLAILVSA